MKNLMRRQLNSQLKLSAPLPRTPLKGWLSTIREALGMSKTQFSRRLGLSPAGVSKIEEREREKSITLASLNQAAQALNCQLHYILIPNEPLDDMVKNRAKEKAQRILERVSHTMALENQCTSAEEISHQVEELASELLITSPSKLWDDE